MILMNIHYKMEEEFTSPENRTQHYNKHIVKGKEYKVSEDEYEEMADTLALTPVNHKNIHGYIAKRDGRQPVHIKWDSNNQLFIVYFWVKIINPKLFQHMTKVLGNSKMTDM